MEQIIRKVIRRVGTKEIEGTMIKDGSSYKYSYPENLIYAKNLHESDKLKIANKLGLAQNYVNAVLTGKKFNEEILLEAEKIAEFNLANGYCKKNVEVIEIFNN